MLQVSFGPFNGRVDPLQNQSRQDQKDPLVLSSADSKQQTLLSYI